MKKERAIYAGDVVRIVNGDNAGGQAGFVGAQEMRGPNILRVVHGVEIRGNNEINVVVYRDEARKEGMYRYAIKNIELVLTPSGKTKRQRAPRGEPWDVRPYPPADRHFRVAQPMRRIEPVDVPAPRPNWNLPPAEMVADIVKQKAARAVAKPAEKADDERRIEAKERFTNSIMNGSGVSQWLYRTASGWKQFVGAACHANIRGSGLIHEHYEGIAGVYNKMTDEAKAEYRRWFDYLVNRSPWKDVYITKDFDDALANHVSINVQMSSPVVMGAITILRTGHEYPRIRTLFCKLVDEGVPEFAAMAAQAFMGYTVGQFTTGGLHTNHTIFDSYMHPEKVLSFMLNGYEDKWKNINVFHKTREIAGEWSFGIFNSIVKNDNLRYNPKTLPWVEEAEGGGLVRVHSVNLDKFKQFVIKFQEKANVK